MVTSMFNRSRDAGSVICSVILGSLIALYEWRISFVIIFPVSFAANLTVLLVAFSITLTGIASTTSQNFALLNFALLSESAAEQFTGRDGTGRDGTGRDVAWRDVT
jgi:hypothetical protein